MSKELREQIKDELCDLFYHHDYNFEELSEYAVKRARNAVLDEVIEAVESNRGLLPRIDNDEVVSTSDKLAVQYYHAGVDSAQSAIEQLKDKDK